MTAATLDIAAKIYAYFQANAASDGYTNDIFWSIEETSAAYIFTIKMPKIETNIVA